MKKAILGLLLATTMMFGAGVTLTDSSGTSNMPAVTVVNLTTPVDIRNNIVTGLYTWTLLNADKNPCFVEFFDSTAANVVLGTTTPIFIIPIQDVNNLSLALPVRGYDVNIQNHNLSVAAVTAPNGTSTCKIGVTGSIVITNN